MKKGFTLVELVIVIVIVGILSIVAVPIYKGYVEKAKTTEGMALVSALAQAEKVYYAEHGAFYIGDMQGSGNSVTYNEELGIDARGNKYYKYFYVVPHANGFSAWAYSEDRGTLYVGLWYDSSGSRPRMLTYDITTGEYKDIR